MKIAYYYPKQISPHATLFCKYTGDKFFHQKCNANTDLIFAGSVSALSQAVQAKKMFNRPLVGWCWDIPYSWREWQMSENGLARNAGRDAKNNKYIALLKQCDLVMVGSKFTQRILQEQYNIASMQIYSYVDTDSIKAVPVQKKRKQIIQISRYYFNKKFEHTIQASRDLSTYRVVFVGFSPDLEYIRELKEHVDKYDRKVIFKENLSREDVITNLKQSTVLTSPSVHEGFGITPIEALYCKVPVLLSDLEVFQEIYGDNVLYHKMNDPEDMKEKLERLVRSRALQKKIVENCQPIISQFTPKKFAKRWKKAIN